jgi:hypothetical protein
MVDMFCQQTHPPIWNSTQCLNAYQTLPSVIQAVRLSLNIPTVENRLKALNTSWQVETMDLHGIKRENYLEKVSGAGLI